MQITVHLKKAVATAFRDITAEQAPAKALSQELKRLKVHLEPLHGDAEDPELATHFYMVADSAEQATQLVDRLLKVPGVHAAYVKPPDAPPAS